MLIMDENSQAYILENIHVPTPSEYFWVLDLNIMDFTLAPLTFLEETICPTITLSIKDFVFNVPANWNILVYDSETLQLDVAEISDLTGNELKALVYGPKKFGPEPGNIRVVNYYVENRNVGPSLNKNQMLCHPISPNTWINISPSDSYNKYLKDCVVSDIIQF